MMEAIATSAEQRLVAIENALESVLGSLPGIRRYQRYLSAEITPTTLMVIFRWPGQVDHATGGITMNTYDFEAFLYTGGRERDRAQSHINVTLLRMQDINRSNTRLNDTCQRWSLFDGGGARFEPGGDNSAPLLVKPFRIRCEAREF